MGKHVRLESRAPQRSHQAARSEFAKQRAEESRRAQQWVDRANFYGSLVIIVCFVFTVVWGAYPFVQNMVLSDAESTAIEGSIYYPGCNQVRTAGKAPLYAGQPGYRPGMDGDDDGVACEGY